MQSSAGYPDRSTFLILQLIMRRAAREMEDNASSGNRYGVLAPQVRQFIFVSHSHLPLFTVLFAPPTNTIISSPPRAHSFLRYPISFSSNNLLTTIHDYPLFFLLNPINALALLALPPFKFCRFELYHIAALLDDALHCFFA